jgi:hypothetical protein
LLTVQLVFNEITVTDIKMRTRDNKAVNSYDNVVLKR